MLKRVDGPEWAKIMLEWEEEADNFGENFGDHAPATLPLLEDLAHQPNYKQSAVFAFDHQNKTIAVLQANHTFLPGFKGKVLRIRHLIFSPGLELDDKFTIEDYKQFLADILLAVIDLTQNEMPTDDIKFHMRSRAEIVFTQFFAQKVKERGIFDVVNTHGAWIHLSKT